MMKPHARWRSERGQAFTETLLVTGIMLAFLASVYQLFLVNETIYRAIAAAHQNLFRYGFESNCYDKVKECTYNTDTNAKVIWNANDIPEIKVPIVGMFRSASLKDVRLISHVRPPEPKKGCPVPCKKSKMAAGTYMDPEDVLLWVVR